MMVQSKNQTLCTLLIYFLFEWMICIKIDPEEERRLLAKEKKASRELMNNTLKRHTLVLKKRDLMRKKAEDDKKKMIAQLLALEGLELDTDSEDDGCL